MENKKKIDDQIMKKLEANTIRRPICLTNKGALELVIVKGGNEYYLTLDSVPVTKELNRELMGILFTPQVVIPSEVLGVKMTKQNIQDIMEGKPILINPKGKTKVK